MQSSINSPLTTIPGPDLEKTVVDDGIQEEAPLREQGVPFKVDVFSAEAQSPFKLGLVLGGRRLAPITPQEQRPRRRISYPMHFGALRDW